jgi:hypothetical protein
MKLVNEESLAATLDAVSEALYSERPIPQAEREETASWIAGRQGLPRAYADMFAPTAADFAGGVRLFTGEKVSSRVGTSHILGEEACRILLLLDSRQATVVEAMRRASHGMQERLASEPPSDGMYCCGTCSPAFWRHLAAGGLSDGEALLTAAMRTLKGYRTADGKWRRFPFYYTLLAASEIDLPIAGDELRHAAPACQRLLKRPAGEAGYNARRRRLAEKVLARC